MRPSDGETGLLGAGGVDSQGESEEVMATKVKEPIASGECIWVEDDASRSAGDSTRMTIYKKWRELFGEEFDQKNALQMYDGGDHFQYLMPNGYVVDRVYDGDYLYAPVREQR